MPARSFPAMRRHITLRRFQGFLAVFLLMLIVGVFFPVLAQDQADLTVDAAQDMGPISPYIFGANFGQEIITPDLVPLVQAMGIKFLRLGGGFSDRSDIDKTIFGIYVAQAKQIGAEFVPTVRLLNGSPEKAADFVRYANIEKDYHIKYWSIGNEPGEYVALKYASSYTTDDLNKNWRAIAQAMLAVDPNIVLIGPDIDQYVVLNADPLNLEYLQPSSGGHPHDSLGRDWLQEFLRVNGDLVGFVSIHRYPYPGLSHLQAASATIDGLRQNSREWDISIPNLRKVIRSAAGRDIPIAITEFNSNSIPSSGGEAGLDSLYNAVWQADVLGRLIRQKVAIALYWVLRSKGDGFGLIGLDKPRPSYYTYVLYKQFGSELLASSSTDQDVNIYAARRDDGALTLMVVNLGPDEATKSLHLNGFTPGGDTQVWRLDATHNAEQVDGQAVKDGGTITVPGQSVTLYVVPGS